MRLNPLQACALLYCAFFGICGCARVGVKHPGACPEYEDLVCMTEIDCDRDELRGCDVCVCTNDGWDPQSEGQKYMPPASAEPAGN